MKRHEITREEGNRIFRALRVLERSGRFRTSAGGPRHDPFTATTYGFDSQTHLGRVLGRLGFGSEECEIGIDFDRFYSVIRLSRDPFNPRHAALAEDSTLAKSTAGEVD